MTSSLITLILLFQTPVLSTAKSIWSETPGTWNNESFIKTSYPLGNGRLGGVNSTPYLLGHTIANQKFLDNSYDSWDVW